ncbi:hypothetical protein GDO78_012969 [Eleutherodactylus coqui]|uniref:Uncharacterized protein n=1 Tax=Eleutherodactylus coqui TaxID=57060 RepID=A0A8J6EYY6_ELECQ|nr:hypothetical protein GDO78_012969 [Eleutherodactylus coqui]
MLCKSIRFRFVGTRRFTPPLSFFLFGFMRWYLLHTRSRIAKLHFLDLNLLIFGTTFVYTILLSTFPDCEYFFALPRDLFRMSVPLTLSFFSPPPPPPPFFFPFYCWKPNSSEHCNES